MSSGGDFVRTADAGDRLLVNESRMLDESPSAADDEGFGGDDLEMESEDGGVDEEGLELDDVDALEEGSDVDSCIDSNVSGVSLLGISCCAEILGLGLVEISGVPTAL